MYVLKCHYPCLLSEVPHLACPWATCCPHQTPGNHIHILILCTGTVQCILNMMYILNLAQPSRLALCSRKVNIVCPIAHATLACTAPDFVPSYLGVCWMDCIYSIPNICPQRKLGSCAPPHLRTFPPAKRSFLIRLF